VLYTSINKIFVLTSRNKISGYYLNALLFAIGLVCCISACKSTWSNNSQKVIVIDKSITNPFDKKDDTQALLAVFNNLRPGQSVEFGIGTFILSEPLAIKVDGVTVSGRGDSTVIQFSNKYDLYERYNRKRVGMINVIANHVTIQDLKIDQNFRGSGRVDGQSTPLVGGILIGGVYLGHPKRTTGVRITRCTVYDYYGDAISAWNALTDDIEMTYNHVISAYIASHQEPDTKPWTRIANANNIHGEQGLNVLGGTNIKINNNHIEGSLDDAIATHSEAYNVEIKNNVITTGSGRILVNGAKNCIVENNDITYIHNGSGAIWVAQECNSHRLSKSENVTIINNRIRVNKGVKTDYLISIRGTGDNITVAKNKLEGNGIGHGINIIDATHRCTKTYHFGKNYNIIDNYINDVVWAIVVGPLCPSNQPKKNDITIENNTISNISNPKGVEIQYTNHRRKCYFKSNEDPCLLLSAEQMKTFVCAQDKEN